MPVHVRGSNQNVVVHGIGRHENVYAECARVHGNRLITMATAAVNVGLLQRGRARHTRTMVAIPEYRWICLMKW